MTKNIGPIDRLLRIILGVALIAFAIPIGFPAMGWNWLGWIGVAPLLTAIVGTCPFYGLVGLSTCARP